MLYSFEDARACVRNGSEHRSKAHQEKTHRNKAQTTFYSNVVKSVGDDAIKEDTTHEFIEALRTVTLQCLSQSGIFVLTGLATFERKDVKAKPAQYSNLKGYRSRIIKARGPQRSVYGRVHVEIKKRTLFCTPCSAHLVIQESFLFFDHPQGTHGDAERQEGEAA